MYRLKTQIVLLMAILIVPLLLVLVSYNLYTLRFLNSQVANNNKDIISIYEKSAKQDMDYLSFSMANSLANNKNMLQLNYSDSYVDAYVCCNNISLDFRALVASDLEGLGALMVYSSNYDVSRIIYSDSGLYSYSEKCELKKYIDNLLKENDINKKGWQLATVFDNNFLIRVLNNYHVSIIMIIDTNLISKPQDGDKNIQSGFLLYTSNDYNPITMEEFIESENIQLRSTAKNYYITGKRFHNYMVVEKDFEYGEIRQFYISPYQGAYQYLDFVQIILIFLTLATALIIPIGFYYMKKTLFMPLERMTNTMEDIRAGNIDAHMNENYNSIEFDKVEKTFNTMIDNIKELKINAYEKEIQYKNIQMQYLQIQIRPHFFLNCLKNIYAMAEQAQYAKIQEMILMLSKYLRNMFRSNPDSVSIEEEIEGVNNYITLQQMCLSNPPECNIIVEKSLMDIRIPPFSVITFIENSVKHGGVTGKHMVISIHISKITSDDENYICITILDNGPGFPLNNLEDKNDKSKSMEHIGIVNIKERIELQYGEKGNIIFSNSNGACVEIFIPILENEEK